MHSSGRFTAMFCKFWEIDMLNSNVDTCNYSPACICEKKTKKKKQEKKEYSLGGRGLTHLPESLSTVYKYIKGAYSEPT